MILMVTIIIYFPLPVAYWWKYNGLFGFLYYSFEVLFDVAVSCLQ